MDGKEMIYGTRAVIEAILAGREIERVMIQSGMKNELVHELLDVAKKHAVPISFVPQEKLKRISSKNHQGVICFLSAVSYALLDNVVHQVFSDGREPFLLILDRVTDVRNFGAIARTAECAGVDGIIIPQRETAPITSDAMKTSAGALNHLAVCRERDLKKTIVLLRESGVKILACTEKAEKNLYDCKVDGPVALIVGSEEDGIDNQLLREADELIRIPQYGKINSLNVSVAAGIAMYEIVRQRNIKGS